MTIQRTRVFLCCVLCAVALLPLTGCQVVDQATGVGDANVSQSLRQPEGTLTRKELSQKLRRLAMSYLGDVTQTCESLASDNPNVDQRLLALRIRADSADSITAIAADPDPQIGLLNMVTVLTLHRMMAEEQGEAFFGDRAPYYRDFTERMEREAWILADQVMDDEEIAELRSLIRQYRVDHPDRTYVWWVRFSAFSGYREMFSVAGLGRGVVDLFVPASEAAAGLESTSDIAERATWLAARQSLIVQWRLELAYLLAVSSPETERMMDELERASTTLAELPNHFAREREAILAALDDQEEALGRLITQADGVVTNINTAILSADQTVASVQGTVDSANTTVVELRTTIASAEESLTNVGEILPQAESTLAQLEQTSNSLNQTLQTLDTFTRQFDSDDAEAGTSSEPSRPFDINEYTLAVQEAGKTVEQLNALVTNVDSSTQPDRLDEKMDRVGDRISALIWQAGGVLLGVGVILILVAKLVPRRAAK